MGRFFRKHDIRPDIVITSPAQRAQSTAQIISNEIEFDGKGITVNEHLYLDGKEQILQAVKQVDDRYDTVFIFGHNPDMTELANSL